MGKKIDEAIAELDDFDEDKAFKTALVCSEKKLDEYWALLIDGTPYYAAAVILHPMMV